MKIFSLSLKTLGLGLGASLAGLSINANADPLVLSEITVVATALEVTTSQDTANDQGKENALRLIREQIRKDLQDHLRESSTELIVKADRKPTTGRS